MPWRDDPDDDLDDSEYPDEPEDDQDEDPTAPCPYCHRPVYDDAEWCPSCGKYLSREDAPAGRPWWLVVGVLAGLAVVLGWVLLGR
jgi:hypothetical protein